MWLGSVSSTATIWLDRSLPLLQRSRPGTAGQVTRLMPARTVTGKPAWIPLGTTANKQGRVAGENAVGGSAKFGGVAGTNITKVFNLGVAQTGLSEAAAEREGLSADAVKIRSRSRHSAYPGADPIDVKLVFEPNRLEVTDRSGRKAGLNYVNPQFFQLGGKPQLFSSIHAGAGRLLAVAERRVQQVGHAGWSHRADHRRTGQAMRYSSTQLPSSRASRISSSLSSSTPP